MTLDSDGLLSLSPPAAMADEIITREVTATDGLGTEVVFTLAIDVAAPVA